MTTAATPSQSREREPDTDRGATWIAVIGNPNTGKTTLFNALTGGRARVGNYPGVTVDKRVGTLRGAGSARVELLDLPGTYSLAARTPDEMIAVEALIGHADGVPRPDAALVVLDATNLERNLYLLTQVMEAGLPIVVALNMVDGARSRGVHIDADALSRVLGVPVVTTVASRGEGVAALRSVLARALGREGPALPWRWPSAVQEAERGIAHALAEAGVREVSRVEIRRALFDVGGEMERRLVARGGDDVQDAVLSARETVRGADGRLASVEASVRYGWIADVAKACVDRPDEAIVTLSDKIDTVLTHRVFGTLFFAATMTLMFVAMFTWAAPLMDFIDVTVFGGIEQAVRGWAFLGDGAAKSLVVDGVIAGVGAVLVFLPQILILFAFLAVLEGCGYMARGAFLMDRLMRRFGLSGRSFIPMLSSFACAIPGIMAARTIEDRRDRLTTILVAPLMSCSARIPIYVILIAAFVPATKVLGFLNIQGLVFAGMYLLGILVAIAVALLLKRTLLHGKSPAFMVELPPYRIPRPGVVLQRMWEQGGAFLTRAGTVIFAASIVIWALSYFPRLEDAGASARREAEAHEVAMAKEFHRLDIENARQEQAVVRIEAQSEDLGRIARERYAAFVADRHDREEALAGEQERLETEAENRAAGDALAHSFLGRIGRTIEPVFAPIGWDWKVSAAVVASFPAREVVVSTLGIIYDLGPNEDEQSKGLRSQLQSAAWDHGPREGRKVFDLAGALALMVFFALCAQCVSTLATIRKETLSWKWTAFSFTYMTALAYAGALLTAWIVRGIG